MYSSLIILLNSNSKLFVHFTFTFGPGSSILLREVHLTKLVKFSFLDDNSVSNQIELTKLFSL